MRPLRTILLCHHDAPVHWDGMARWLASWSDLQAVVIVQEPRQQLWKRLQRERKRIGWLRLFDVFAFRLWYRLTASASDQRWLTEQLSSLRKLYPPVPASTKVLRVTSPNSAECQALLSEAQPDIVLALVKSMLAERIFTIPATGTFVLHPGICPEYRNSHGCFWALASDDVEKVGMTLLRIDRGVDTGPIFGYYRAAFDDVADSHLRIQHKVVLENLAAIAAQLQAIAANAAPAIATEGRASRAWGQPWLTAQWRWKRHAGRRRDAARHA